MLGGAAAGTPDVEQLGVADFLLLACDGLWDCMSNQQVRGPLARSSALTDLAALFVLKHFFSFAWFWVVYHCTYAVSIHHTPAAFLTSP
jgi:hypothetical protein